MDRISTDRSVVGSSGRHDFHIMSRRTCCGSIALWAGSTLLSPMRAVPGAEAEAIEKLPPPSTTENSVELCLNSRYSTHGLSGVLDAQQTGHILGAAAKAPVVGAFRNVWVSTPDGMYLYDPARHALLRKRAAEAGKTIVLRWETPLAFDAGLAYMPAILASVSLYRKDGPAVVNCPQDKLLCFAAGPGRGLTSELAAHCSLPADDSGWLPDPSTVGTGPVETVLERLQYTANFRPTALTRRQVSQLLWAGYGCTPHMTRSGAAGLTVPSATASYYLTGTIYLVNELGVYRYCNRNPAGDPATRDHRLERIGSNDVREPLAAAVAGLPRAPCYVVLCLKAAHAEQYYAQLETGFVAGNLLIQASAINLGCHFNAGLSLQDRQGIRSLAALPAEHIPQVVVSVGPVAE